MSTIQGKVSSSGGDQNDYIFVPWEVSTLKQSQNVVIISKSMVKLAE